MVHLATETEHQTHLDDLVPLIDAPQLKEPLKVLDEIPEPLMLAWFPCPLDQWSAAQISITDDAMRRGLSVLRYLHSRGGLNLIMKEFGQGTSGKSVFFALLRKLLGPAFSLLLNKSALVRVKEKEKVVKPVMWIITCLPVLSYCCALPQPPTDEALRRMRTIQFFDQFAVMDEGETGETVQE